MIASFTVHARESVTVDTLPLKDAIWLQLSIDNPYTSNLKVEISHLTPEQQMETVKSLRKAANTLKRLITT